jgi:hypothetical protein
VKAAIEACCVLLGAAVTYVVIDDAVTSMPRPLAVAIGILCGVTAGYLALFIATQ